MGAMISEVEKYRKVKPYLAIVFVLLLIGGWFYPPIGFFMLVCMFMAMGIGIIKGRYWCDWLCPRGSFFDSFLSKFSRQKEVPSIFRHWLFRLGWMTLLMVVLTVKLIPLWGDWFNFGKPFVLILTVTTLVGLIFGVIYHQRIWCMFCPMGSMANLLGRGKHRLLVSTACTNCGVCTKVCRMQIKPGEYRSEGVVNHGDCLKCAYCIEKCPRNALVFEKDSTMNQQIILNQSIK